MALEAGLTAEHVGQCIKTADFGNFKNCLQFGQFTMCTVLSSFDLRRAFLTGLARTMSGCLETLVYGTKRRDVLGLGRLASTTVLMGGIGIDST